MRKLQLEIEDLRIESFATSEERGEPGTVQAHSGWTRDEFSCNAATCSGGMLCQCATRELSYCMQCLTDEISHCQAC